MQHISDKGDKEMMWKLKHKGKDEINGKAKKLVSNEIYSKFEAIKRVSQIYEKLPLQDSCFRYKISFGVADQWFVNKRDDRDILLGYKRVAKGKYRIFISSYKRGKRC